MKHWTLWLALDALCWIATLASWRWLRPGSAHCRRLPAGDPSKFVWMRWMDIMGPATTGPDKLYLRRLYVLRTPWGGLMIHWIKTPDWDRDALHSHPWKISKRSSFWSCVLRGGYTEQIARVNVAADGSKVLSSIRTQSYGRGWHAFGIDDVHRISAVKPGTITLVLSGRKRSGWGFWVKDRSGGRIIPWREYIDQFGRDGAR